MIAALFVQADGCYAGIPGVDIWPEARDARGYMGPWPAVSHTPCQRWGRYSEIHPIAGRIGVTGDDGGCFAFSLFTVRAYGGVIEHPKDSKAFVGPHSFNLGKPTRGGWSRSADGIGWISVVDQGHYGHVARKSTWLYAVKNRDELPELIWTPAPQVLPAYAVERYGYEKARRIGVMAAIGGKDKTRLREATPPAFRDTLLEIARGARGLG